MGRKAKLERILGRGKARYIVLNGVVGWGVSTAAAFSAWNWYTHGSLKPVEVAVTFIVFPLGGIVWGNVMWGILKNQYVGLRRREADAGSGETQRVGKPTSAEGVRGP